MIEGVEKLRPGAFEATPGLSSRNRVLMCMYTKGAVVSNLLWVQYLSVQLLNESLHTGIKKAIMTIDNVCIFGADDPNRVVRAPQALAPFILKDLFR